MTVTVHKHDGFCLSHFIRPFLANWTHNLATIGTSFSQLFVSIASHFGAQRPSEEIAGLTHSSTFFLFGLATTRECVNDDKILMSGWATLLMSFLCVINFAAEDVRKTDHASKVCVCGVWIWRMHLCSGCVCWRLMYACRRLTEKKERMGRWELREINEREMSGNGG